MLDRLLIVGALSSETLPVIKHLSQRRLISRRLIAGQLAGCSVAVLTCGVGPEKAASRTRAALERWSAAAVLSMGTCGGLVDHLSVGDVVTACTLYEGETLCPAPHPWPGAEAATIITVDKPVLTQTHRTALARRGGTVCEMEAAAVARVSGSRPFYTLKVVSDMAGGHTDDPPPRPSPVDIARFKATALRLSTEHLVPILTQR